MRAVLAATATHSECQSPPKPPARWRNTCNTQKNQHITHDAQPSVSTWNEILQAWYKGGNTWSLLQATPSLVSLESFCSKVEWIVSSGPNFVLHVYRVYMLHFYYHQPFGVGGGDSWIQGETTNLFYRCANRPMEFFWIHLLMLCVNHTIHMWETTDIPQSTKQCKSRSHPCHQKHKTYNVNPTHTWPKQATC